MPMPDPARKWLSPRIWRSSEANFHQGMDALTASQTYNRDYLRKIREHGFDAVWVRGRLRDLMHSAVLPELNSDKRDASLASLRATIANAKAEGIQLYLFFNEPLAVAADDPFWEKHLDVRGAYCSIEGGEPPCYSLCTSTPLIQAFLADAIDNVVRELSGPPGLGGIILITASELHTHCWSHYSRFGLDDGLHQVAHQPLDCPRCRDREPAQIVSELIACWQRALHKHQPEARLLAWNWSWSMWYRDPQREVIDRLPAGVELLADFERGAKRAWYGTELLIDEYSLGFVGPGDRFKGSQDAARSRGLPIHAKLQIGATHEMASVPNIPLIKNLHGKLVELHRRDIAGAMCTWAIGCSLTINTFAMGLFVENPTQYEEPERFFDALANRYFGLRKASTMIDAWRMFSEAFDLFPFSIRFLYFGPMNVAPGIPLIPHHRDAPLRGTWQMHEDYGDQYESCCHPFSVREASNALKDMADLWDSGLRQMANALLDANIASREEPATQRRFEEYSCARMIGIQLRSSHHLLAFHDWKLRRMAALKLRAPCDIPLDDEARGLIEAERANVQPAVDLTRLDGRLGVHHEARCRQYDADSIRRKLARMSLQT